LFKNQIITGDYSKTPFLMRSAALFTEIKLRVSSRQGLLFPKDKHKLTKSFNAENEIRQVSRANASEGEDHNFFQIVHLNPNQYGNEVRGIGNFFLNLFIQFIFEYYFFFLFHATILKYYYVQNGQLKFIIFFFFINSMVFL